MFPKKLGVKFFFCTFWKSEKSNKVEKKINFSLFEKVKNRKKWRQKCRLICCGNFFHYAKTISIIIRIVVYMSIFSANGWNKVSLNLLKFRHTRIFANHHVPIRRVPGIIFSCKNFRLLPRTFSPGGHGSLFNIILPF